MKKKFIASCFGIERNYGDNQFVGNSCQSGESYS